MEIEIHRLESEPGPAVIAGLADVLIDTVLSGASVGWTSPPDREEAEAWWRGQLAASDVDVWIARDETGRVLGTVSLQRAMKKNGLHRAEVAKLMVHRNGRGQGISSRLMQSLEAFARADGRWLLLLDTESGSLAESLYHKWGWQEFGRVESYTVTADGQTGDTTFLMKRLDGAATSGS
jgi:GNAT superfamily N-acetyltransferase